MGPAQRVERAALAAAWSMGAVALLRVLTLGGLALTDNTESRYASIAWEMWRSGDWVTPRVFIKGALVPFWGKPPLEFWLTTISYHLLGVGEAAARASSYLLGALIVAMTVGLARRLWGGRVAAASGIILCSSVLFFVLSGACVLDVPLSAAVTGAMASFALFVETRATPWGLAFFFALGVGMLAKGPIALVLVGLALGLWLLLTGRWKVLAKMPWVSGTILFTVVAGPWYALAERATPGFLRYFLVNEHFLRYVSHNYGDLYGSGRVQPYGASWVMLVGSILPWTVVAGVACTRSLRGKRLVETFRADPWLVYGLVWGLTPPLFFTMARQMLFTYLLPGLPGLAIVTGAAFVRWAASDRVEGLLRLLRWHLVVLAGLLGAAALAGLAPAGPSPMAASGMAFAAVAVAVTGWGCLRRQEALGASAVIAFAAASVYAGAIFSLGPRIDEEYSAKTVLTRVFADPQNGGRPVLMPYGDGYSAIFYTEAILGGRMAHRGNGGERLIRESLEAQRGEVFLFKRKQWNRLTPSTRESLSPIAETPHWVATQAAP